MTSLYKCDKCGKTFEAYDDAYHCEESHFTIERGWSDFNELLNALTEYSDGNEIPTTIAVELTGKYNSDTEDNERKFVLYSKPVVISGKNAKELEAKLNEKRENDRRQRAEWRKEYEERKAKEEAEKAEKTEA